MTLRVKKFTKLFVMFITCIIVINISGCNQKKTTKAETPQKNLNIYVDVKDRYSSNVIKFLIDEYKTKHKKVNISLNNGLGSNLNSIEEIEKGKEMDLIITNRNNLFELNKKGYVSELDSIYEKGKINEKFYNIISSYGRIGEKYYGIGLIPYSIEFLYNKKALKEANIKEPANIEEWLNGVKQISTKGTKVPVILTEDLDIHSTFFTLLAEGNFNKQHLEENFDSGKACYEQVTQMQKTFDKIKELIPKYGLSVNTFEVGQENSISDLVNGQNPLMVSISYFGNKLNQEEVGMIETYTMGDNQEMNLPVIVNALLCVPVNTKNTELVNEFIEFVFSEETQKKLVENGMISGNKKANEKITGISKGMVKHIYEANQNSILMLYNLPHKVVTKINAVIKDLLNNKSSDKAWENILKECYPEKS